MRPTPEVLAMTLPDPFTPISGRLRRAAMVAVSLLCGVAAAAPAQPARHVLELRGAISRADVLRWIDVPFEVPAGVERIDVEFSHSGSDVGTAVEVGLLDPDRPRGNSRTSKQRFYVARSSATPSYTPGPLPPGRWHLRLGVPSIRDGVTSTWRATIRFGDEDDGWADATIPARDAAAPGPRWLRGDFHTHTGHSDGFGCDDGRGGRRACTVFDVAAAATARGLDFVAITDHNTTSHHAEIALVQGASAETLLVRGQEVTTFHGHANVYGTDALLDFRVGHPGVTATSVFSSARRGGALVSINHPGRETGERCTGCGWSADTDYTQVDAMEVVNGQVIEGPTAGLPVWRARLDDGVRIIAIGGSDDHAGGRDGAGIGSPTTLVFADALTERGVLDGVRAGRVYIRTRGPEGPSIDMTARRLDAPEARPSAMGAIVDVGASGATVRLSVAVGRAQGQLLEVWRDHQTAPVERRSIDGEDAVIDVDLRLRPGGWAHVVLRDAAGLTAIGNPVFAR